MKQIIQNLALFGLVQYCLNNDIRCSGSHVQKRGRGFTFDLVDTETGKPLASVTFSKISAPAYRPA
jgi:hypothetical protein